jgi:hypothetical protein
MVTNFFRQEADNLNNIERMRTGEAYQETGSQPDEDGIQATLFA